MGDHCERMVVCALSLVPLSNVNAISLTNPLLLSKLGSSASNFSSLSFSATEELDWYKSEVKTSAAKIRLCLRHTTPSRKTFVGHIPEQICVTMIVPLTWCSVRICVRSCIIFHWFCFAHILLQRERSCFLGERFPTDHRSTLFFAACPTVYIRRPKLSDPALSSHRFGLMILAMHGHEFLTAYGRMECPLLNRTQRDGQPHFQDIGRFWLCSMNRYKSVRGVYSKGYIYSGHHMGVAAIFKVSFQHMVCVLASNILAFISPIAQIP